ncbi:hypothetical protein MVEN_01580700 [Mycena venus]|uniref:Uncharacterized protein n=1 Tax=Mycena venus TaxID=2733690 RepID=A0A8H6XS68_9AGAR|nr:hypothetical protein MVEN_01580700 [Mycena venus]
MMYQLGDRQGQFHRYTQLLACLGPRLTQKFELQSMIWEQILAAEAAAVDHDREGDELLSDIIKVLGLGPATRRCIGAWSLHRAQVVLSRGACTLVAGCWRWGADITNIHNETLIDFICYAQLQSHTSRTLDTLQKSLNTFHANKQIIIDLGVREHFNIPKFHAIKHYVDSIRALGSPDGYNTESTKHLHIDFTKKAYRASNRCDYVEQMALWLQHQEAVTLCTSYLDWYNVQQLSCCPQPPTSSDDSADKDVEEDVPPTADTSSATPPLNRYTISK